MGRYAKKSNKASIQLAAMAFAVVGLCGCGSTSSVGSLLGTVSGVADVVSTGAKVAFFTEGLGGMRTLGVVPRYPGGSSRVETLGIDLEAMETAIDVMEAADDVGHVADEAAEAAEDVARAGQLAYPLLHPPSAAD